MILGADTRRDALLRVVLGLLVGLPTAGLAFLHLGWASPFGLVLAVPAGYLLYASVKDGVLLARRRAPDARPRFLWFAIAGLLGGGYWVSTLWM